MLVPYYLVTRSKKHTPELCFLAYQSISKDKKPHGQQGSATASGLGQRLNYCLKSTNEHIGISYWTKLQYYFPHQAPYFLRSATLWVLTSFPQAQLWGQADSPQDTFLLTVPPTQEKHRYRSDAKSFAAIVYRETYREEEKITLGESQRFQKTENSKQ